MPFGGYPGTFGLMELHSIIATPNDANSFDNINLCGPFDLRWKINVPPPNASATASIIEPTAGNPARQLAVQAVVPKRFTESANITKCDWQVRYATFDVNLGEGEWSQAQALTGITGVSGTVALPQPPVKGTYIYEVQSQCTITPWTITTYTPAETVTGLGVVTSSFALAAIRPHGGSDATQAATTQALHLTCSPNPAQNQTSVSYNLEEDGVVTLEVLDALQRVVFKPFDRERQTAGTFALLLPLAHLPTGSYSMRLTCQNTSGQTLRSMTPIILTR